jgi:hypothetical protein
MARYMRDMMRSVRRTILVLRRKEGENCILAMGWGVARKEGRGMGEEMEGDVMVCRENKITILRRSRSM